MPLFALDALRHTSVRKERERKKKEILMVIKIQQLLKKREKHVNKKRGKYKIVVVGKEDD